MSEKYFWLKDKTFWLETTQNVLQSFMATFLSAVTIGSDVMKWNWVAALSLSGGAALYELGRSILAAHPKVQEITNAIGGQQK